MLSLLLTYVSSLLTTRSKADGGLNLLHGLGLESGRLGGDVLRPSQPGHVDVVMPRTFAILRCEINRISGLSFLKE